MITGVYHVGGVAHWREVVSEQLRLLGKAKFPGLIHCHYGGPKEEQWFIMRVAEVHGLEITFLPNEPGREEAPAIRFTQEYAMTCDPDEHILYFHNKGCGTPNSWRHVMWRWMLNYYILVEWEKALATLQAEGLDWVGPQCFRDGDFPHGAGNFFIARSAHLRRLEPFERYYATFLEKHPTGRPHWMSRRHASEMWIGSDGELNFASLMPEPMMVELSNHQSWCAHPEAQVFATRHGS
jgi:hypothetical protein